MHRLVLDDHQGGLTFGPLGDEVRVGSDPSCGIVLAPRHAAPPVAVVLSRAGDAWRLHLPGALPHPCRLTRGPTRRPAAVDDVLRVGDVLEITGPDEDLRLTLVDDDAPAPPARPAVVAAPRPAPDPTATPTVPAADRWMIAVGLLAVALAALLLLAVHALG